MRKALQSVYAVAALSFGAGILRDWQLVSNVGEYKLVFGAMYSVALAASFAVNALTLGHGFDNSRKRQWSLLAFSLILFWALAEAWQPIARPLFWLTMPVPVLYVVGALYSRRLLDAGYVFVARMRDGVSSICMVLLIAVGMGSVSFPVSVLVATCLISTIARRVPARNMGAMVEHMARPQPIMGYLGTIFYSNVAALLINAWAMFANSLEGRLFGVEISVAVRLSMYFFQLFSLPSILLSRSDLALGSPRKWVWLTWVCIALSAIVACLPLKLSIFAYPIAALGALYCSVLLMNASYFEKSRS